MTKSRKVALGLALAMGVAGCELIVDFDRTKIDAGAGDGSVLPDVSTQDAPAKDVAADVPGDVGSDVVVSDAGDAGSDGALDDGADASDGATE